MTHALKGPSFMQRSSPIYYAPAWAAVNRPAGLAEAGEEVDYLSVIRRVWRRKFLILGACAVVTGATAAVAAFLPRHYVADALVLVDNTNGDTSSLLIGSNANNAPALPPPDAEAVQTEVEILQSPALAVQVIRDLKLENRKEFNPAVEKSPQPAATRAGATAQLAQTLKNFMARLHVETKGNSRVIDVAFDAQDPKLAAAITNALVDRYIANQQELRSKTATQQAKWLQGRIDVLQQQAAKDEQAIAEFRAKAGLFSVPGGSPLLLKEMSNVSDELARAQAHRAMLEDRLQQLRASLSSTIDATSDLLDSPVMRELRTREAALEAQFALNSQNYGPRYPKTVALSAQLTKLKGEMRLEAQKIAAALQNNVDVARMTERQLTNRLNALKQDVTKMNGADVKLGALQRQAEADRLVLSNYLARFKEIGQQADRPPQRPTSEVVSHAQVPISPSKPKRALLIGIAAACSLVGSCAFVLFRDKANRSFRSLEELEATIGISGLGLIPLAQSLGMQSPVRISRYGSGSSYREALKAIYTRLFVLFENKAKTTLVTSAFPGEGKTTLALSLATMAAQSGHRTIVVDADFWRAGATKALGIHPRGPGLADVLDQRATLADALISDTTSGVDILPPGKFSDLRAVRVNNLATMLEVLVARYEFVVIDSPPVFAVSEALVLAAHADQTVMTVRWGKTPRDAVALALKRLREAGAEVVGATLAFVDEREHALYGYAESAYFSKEIVRYYAHCGAISWSAGSGRTAKQSIAAHKFAAAVAAAANGIPAEFFSRLIRWSHRSMPRREKIPQYKDPKSVLLVLDVQEQFIGSPAWYSLPRAAATQLIEVVKDVTKKAKESGVFVGYVQHGFGRGPSNIFGRYLFGRRATEARDFHVRPQVHSVSGYSFSTPRVDAFSNPKLDVFLRNRQVNHIFLMGVDGVTSVARTATSAIKRGYNVTFIGDGIVTAFEKKWARKLKDFAADEAFAITSEEFRDLLGRDMSLGRNGIVAPPYALADKGSAAKDRNGGAVEAKVGAIEKA